LTCCLIIPDWLVIVFLFAIGASVGSFLNVVVYRLPRDLSIIRPGSACPSCKTPIPFYDNIPVLSWLLLMGKCRKCKSRISPRYFIIELLTASIFVGVYVLYFMTSLRKGIGEFFGGGFVLYLAHVIMLSAFVAASAIDLEFSVIPLGICWIVTVTGLAISVVSSFIYDPVTIKGYDIFPTASAKVSILAGGALIGLVISLLLLLAGVIKRSYPNEKIDIENFQNEQQPAKDYNHRLEMLKEIIFLLPIVVGAFAALKLYQNVPQLSNWWIDFSQAPVIAGLGGSLWGYFIGCAIVWAARIFGTFVFGREAMGLGDVHLMGAAGAVLGPWPVVIAFFIAPFFGLVWAVFCMFFKKIRQIPYGPFLSMGLFAVMILHDAVRNWLLLVLYR
jgi:leader peptidase (prepilin peptidase)/N-methyltransferase